MGFTDGTPRPKVSSLKLIWLTTLIFCLQHRCTKNQSLQVSGRVEQRIKSSEVLQTPPEFLTSFETSLKLDVQLNSGLASTEVKTKTLIYIESFLKADEDNH